MIEKVEYPEFHTFEEARQYLTQGNHIDYEVKIDGHTGALMTREEWLEAVEGGSFIDYDGMGNEIDADGNMLGCIAAVWNGEPRKSNLIGLPDPGYIYPSTASKIRSETKFILWYNK